VIDMKPRRWNGRIASIAGIAVVVASSALLAAGCGGGSSGARVAQVGTTTTSASGSGSSGGSGKADPAAYSACMRKNGVPDFPDPDSSGRFRITGGQDKSGRTFGLDPNSPQFKRARQACKKLEPSGKPDPQQEAKDRQQSLKFSQCMRSHGVPKFPDPQFQPNGGSLLRVGKDLNPNSPRFKAAAKTCQKLLPGAPGVAPPPGP
jgi:hypothetical protein